MSQDYGDWDDLGRNIQEIIDRAVNSRDYQKLNQTVSQIIGRAVDRGSEAVRKAMDASARSAAAPRCRQEPAPGSAQNIARLYGSTGNQTAAGILKAAGGGILTLCMLPTFLSLLIASLLITGNGAVTFSALLTLAGLGCGIWLLCSGVHKLQWLSRFKVYRRILGQSTHCALEKLARGVRKSREFVRREVRQMIDAGLFLEGHLDREETCLITSDETYRYYEQSRRQLEQRQQEAEKQPTPVPKAAPSSAVQDVLNRGNAFIAQIRSCNDAIPGDEISRKISRMETIVRKIFERAQAHPEIVPDLKKLMDYYLPMTIKLLNAYADMDAQPIQGDTIENSKREIETTLDTLNVAFERLLDDLFADTALDVSSDISVLNTLLAQEGLTDDELTKIKKQKVSEKREILHGK